MFGNCIRRVSRYPNQSCDNFYSKTHEGGIRYDDPALAIDWEIDLEEVIVAEKDLALPFFGKHRL